MSQFELLSLTTSILAVLISTVALIRTRKLAKEQLELEKVTAELSRLQIEVIDEERNNKTKPELNVSINKIGDSYSFYISNTGQGSAYNLTFKLLNCSNSPLFEQELTEVFPYQELKPSSRIKLLASIGFTSPKKYQSKISWENKKGERFEETFWTCL